MMAIIGALVILFGGASASRRGAGLGEAFAMLLAIAAGAAGVAAFVMLPLQAGFSLSARIGSPAGLAIVPAIWLALLVGNVWRARRPSRRMDAIVAAFAARSRPPS